MRSLTRALLLGPRHFSYGLLVIAFSVHCLGVEVVYPTNAGVINVKTAYGAKGDGVTDDTDAIVNAVRNNVGQWCFAILYFPSGTYMVRKSIPYLATNGNWGAYLTLQGENQSNTTIQLFDNTPAFQDPTNPSAVIFTASNTGDIFPSSDLYNPDGGGNAGFRNNIMNLTINTGSGNPGAIGIDYLANNNSRMSDVSIVSQDGQGVYGLNIQRGWAGPMLLTGVQINGFSTGIAVNNTEGVWAEHVGITGQLVSGIDINGGSLSIRGLTSTNSAPAIRIPSWTGVLSLVGGTLAGGSPSSSAIELGGAASTDTATVFLENVSSTGYKGLVYQNGHLLAASTQTQWSSTPATHLFTFNSKPLMPVQDTPTYTDNNFADWASVVSYGAQPNNPTVSLSTFDSTASIQAALNSGQPTVYLPPGNYLISDTIQVPPTVKRLIFLSAYLIPFNDEFPANAPAIQINGGPGDTVFVEGLGLSWNGWIPNNPNLVFFPETNFVNNSAGTLVLTDADYIGYANTPASAGGTVFLESIFGADMLFANETVFARSLDPENSDSNPHVHVSGGSFWALGLTIEGTLSPVLVNDGGATSEVLGFVAAIQDPVPPSIPMVSNNDSSLTIAAFADSAANFDYAVLVNETFGGVTKNLYGAASGLSPSASHYGGASAISFLADAP